MIYIDKYAYNSNLKKIDPGQKLFFSVLTLGVCLWANNILISIAILFLMGWFIVSQGKTPFIVLLKLLLIPLAFLIIGVLTIAFNISPTNELFIFSLKLGKIWLGISKNGLYEASNIFFKALGAVSCLYFLALSTPIVDLLVVLKKLRIPNFLVEIMSLIYRFIFLLLETAETIFIAQSSRLGYVNISSGYRSLGSLASTLFLRSYKRANDLYIALEARGYDGELNVLEEPLKRNLSGYIFSILINIALIICALFFKSY